MEKHFFSNYRYRVLPIIYTRINPFLFLRQTTTITHVPVVHDDHDDAGYPKRDGRRYDGVVSVDDENARHRVLAAKRLMFGGRVPTEKYRQERYERRQRPHVQQHVQNGALRHGYRVLQRADYGVVPVHADAAQVQYGRGGEVHVQAVPHVTHDVAEHPLSGDLDAGVERHGAQSDQEVGERQRHDVVVGEYAELPVPHHAYHHQRVAQHRAQYYRTHGHCLQYEHRAHGAGHVVRHRSASATAAAYDVDAATDSGRTAVSGHRVRRFVVRSDRAADHANAAVGATVVAPDTDTSADAAAAVSVDADTDTADDASAARAVTDNRSS